MIAASLLLRMLLSLSDGQVLFFFFNATATTEVYTLSLHDALPIYQLGLEGAAVDRKPAGARPRRRGVDGARSEEHTSELQSRRDLVCRLLLEKKKKKKNHSKVTLDNYT